MNDALRQAYGEALLRRRADPQRFYSIVVMTDGMNTQGSSLRDFIAWYAGLAPGDRAIRVFPVIFGEADPDELQQVAALTGGRCFDSRKSSLQSIFKEIRGYQ